MSFEQQINDVRKNVFLFPKMDQRYSTLHHWRSYKRVETFVENSFVEKSLLTSMILCESGMLVVRVQYCLFSVPAMSLYMCGFRIPVIVLSAPSASFKKRVIKARCKKW